MVNIEPFLTAFRTAFDPETGLHIPIEHLKGRRIALYLEGGNQLDISYWRFDPKSTLGKVYAGRVHIVPTLLGSELTLIEDILVSDSPGDFPIISERTTSSKGVNISLLYPRSRENWNFRIHYNRNDLPCLPIDDPECEFLIASGRLRKASLSDRLSFKDSEVQVYNPPRTRPITR